MNLNPSQSERTQRAKNAKIQSSLKLGLRARFYQSWRDTGRPAWRKNSPNTEWYLTLVEDCEEEELMEVIDRWFKAGT